MEADAPAFSKVVLAGYELARLLERSEACRRGSHALRRVPAALGRRRSGSDRACRRAHSAIAARPGRPVDPGRTRPETCRVNHRLRHAVNTKVTFDRRIRQRHRAEGRKPQPGRNQAEPLTEMTGFGEDNAVCAREGVAPLRGREDGGHQHERAGAARTTTGPGDTSRPRVASRQPTAVRAQVCPRGGDRGLAQVP